MRQVPTRTALAVILSVAAAAACAAASTSISTLAAPELAGQRVRTIVVLANFEHIGVRRATEEEFIKHSGAGLRFLPSYRIFFPGRVFTPEDISLTLWEHGIEATLVLDPLSSGSTSQYIPPSYSTTCTAWTAEGGCAQTTTRQTTPGVSVSSSWVTTSVKLHEAQSGKSVWVASGITGGNAFAGTGTLLESIVSEIAAGLESDSVTDRRGCLLRDRALVASTYQRTLSLSDSAAVFRLWQHEAANPLNYDVESTPEGRAMIDSINGANRNRARLGAQRLAELPSAEDVAVARRALAGLKECQ